MRQSLAGWQGATSRACASSSATASTTWSTTSGARCRCAGQAHHRRWRRRALRGGRDRGRPPAERPARLRPRRLHPLRGLGRRLRHGAARGEVPPAPVGGGDAGPGPARYRELGSRRRPTA
jgi:hypothetical protein